MKKWLAILGVAAVLGLAGCGGDDGPPAPVPAPVPAPEPGPVPPSPPAPEPSPEPVALKDTTLLVYVVGSDLESRDHAASDNFAEMLAAPANPNVALVLQTGAADKDGWRHGRRQRVEEDRIVVLEELGAADMGRPETLAEFLEWGVASFPARQYMLVLWNHGGGPLGGYGYDELSGSHLSLGDLQAALARGVAAAGQPFELIGFDACLMASVEVAHAIQPYGRYMSASQDVEPGAGMDWQATVEYLAAHPLADGLLLGRVIADSYIAKHVAADDGDYGVYSVTDLGRIPALVAALDSAGTELTAALTDGGDRAWLDVAYARRHSLDFSSGEYFGPTYDLVDLLNFVEQPALQLRPDSLEAIQAALAAAVPHAVRGPQLWTSSGLTMYFPSRSLHEERARESYAALDFSPRLQQWIGRYAQMGLSGAVPTPEIGPIQVRGEHAVAPVSNGHYATAFAALSSERVLWAMKPGGTGPDGLEVALDEDWLTLGGVPVLVFPDDAQFATDSARYTVPVLVQEEDGRQVGLLGVSFEEDLAGNRSYTVDAFYAGGDGFSPVARRSSGVSPDATLFPLNYDMNERRWVVNGSQPISVPAEDDDEPWQLTPQPLSGGGLVLGVNDYLSSMRFSPVAELGR